MANILISYGDSNFTESLRRLKSQAKKSRLFDKIYFYSPKDLPNYITSSPLFAFSKGGGYWIWKPYIIVHTLNNCNIGDIVYYIDAGCSINKNSKDWEYYKNKMHQYNAIFFQYQSTINYGWERFCKEPQNNSTAIIHWTKPLTIDYFINRFNNSDFIEYSKIMGGFCIIKKQLKQMQVLEEWYKICLFRPDLIIDPWGEELNDLPKSYNTHRHDQSILTPLIFYLKDIDNILVLPESSESQKEIAAIIASRFKREKTPFIVNIKTKLYNFWQQYFIRQ